MDRQITSGPQDTGSFEDHAIVPWGKPTEPSRIKADPAVDMKTPPKLQVDRMPAGEFFAYAAEL